MIKQLERSEPRISVNALGEYLISGPTARRRIISDQKRPKPFKVIYYDPAIEVISDFLRRRIDGEELLLARKELLDTPALSDWDRQRAASCAKAMKSLAASGLNPALEGLNVRPAMAKPPKLVIGGVTVSVRPELFLSLTTPDGSSVSRGYLKLFFSKNRPLDRRTGEYIASLVHQFGEMRLVNRGGCDRKLCAVLDVFTNTIFGAPKAVVRKREDTAAACQEIKALWPLI